MKNLFLDLNGFDYICLKSLEIKSQIHLATTCGS